MTAYHAQKYDATRMVGKKEMRRAVLVGTRVKINSDPDEYGYLYKDELYVPIREHDAK